MEYPIESILGITFMMPMIDNGSGEPQSLVSVLHGMLKGTVKRITVLATGKYDRKRYRSRAGDNRRRRNHKSLPVIVAGIHHHSVKL